jgi:hypothetical protein
VPWSLVRRRSCHPTAQPVDRLHQAGDALVHEGDLAEVERFHAGDLLVGGVGALVMPDEVEAVVGRKRRHVPVRVLLRRVPRLMRVEAVHPEKERGVRVVVLQPAARRGEDPRGEVVVGGAPVAVVEEVLQHHEMALPVDRLAADALHQRLDHLARTAAPVVVNLPAHEVPRAESARVVHRGLEHVVRVGDETGVVPAANEDLGEGVVFGRDLMPSGGVMPVPTAVHVEAPREAAHAGHQRAPGLESRLALSEGAVEVRRLRGELVHRGSSYLGERPVVAHDVGAEGVEADHDDVHG